VLLVLNENLLCIHNLDKILIHDIYILIEWEGTPEWNDRISLYFEQDGRVQDFNLGTGVADNYYQGVSSYGPESFRDAHFEDGYTVSETQNGNLKSGYADGIWPPDADIYEPRTWGNMTIVDKKKN